jgi:uncharacterized phage protein (TIGR01671 family)
MKQREIKFRAWWIDKNKWIEGVDSIKFDPNGRLRFVNDLIPANEIRLMQYTGLKDKNGVDIYEGDIIRSEGHKDGVEYKAIQVIEWRQGSVYGGFDAGYWLPPYNFSEVIGNIYENPDLIKFSK